MNVGMMSCCSMLCVSCASRIGSYSMSPLFSPVDVLVVGGTSGGVVAASEAAKRGLKACLIAPRAFLGEDLCETGRFVELANYRGSDDALLRAMAVAPPLESVLPPSCGFSYVADMKPNALHPDDAWNVLLDHSVKRVETGSVQFDGDPTITVTLEKAEALNKVVLSAFRRIDFKVGKVSVEYQAEDGVWHDAGFVEGEKNPDMHSEVAVLFELSLHGVVASALRLHVERYAGMKRVLLGAICVVTEELAQSDWQDSANKLVPYPMTVKRALDAELLDHGVQFIYNTQVVDVLPGQDGCLGGVVVANRSGLQYVRAKVIVDATENGLVARLGGACFRELQKAGQVYRRYVFGGTGKAVDGCTVKRFGYDLQIRGGVGRLASIQPIWEYTFDSKLDALTVDGMMELEQLSRDLTWDSEIVESTGRLCHGVGNRVVGKAACDAVIGVERLPMDCLRPSSLNNVLVLGRNADVCRAMSLSLQEVDTSLVLGRMAGGFAASLADGMTLCEACVPSVSCGSQASRGELKIGTLPHRFGGGEMLNCAGMCFGELGRYDVVVVGGGTGGAPAAIGALRHGAKTLLLEYLSDFGGTSTVGAITRYYYGNICGFTEEIDKAMGRAFPGSADWSRLGKSEWYRQEIRKHGGDIWISSLVFGTVVEGDRVIGVAVATPFGPGIVYGNTVIDATGNADVAAAGGAETFDQDAELAVQGTGLSPMRSGDHYINTDYLFHDDSDIIDVWRSFVLARERFSQDSDLNPIVGTRERRRIVGDDVISPLDIFNNRTYENTVCVSSSNFDSHGYTCHPLFIIKGPGRDRVYADVPFGALLPKGLEGIAVTGLAISGHRDAMPILRMQPDIQNHGYAMGVAAAMACKAGVAIRHIDLKALQRHLVDIGCLPERVLTDTDSYPLPESVVAEAVSHLTLEWSQLAILLAADKGIALPLLRSAYLGTDDVERRLVCGMVLAFFGDDTGKDTLLNVLSSAAEWDEGWNYRGMGQFGPSASRLDSVLRALGVLGAKEAEADILRLVETMDATTHFSHFRAVSLTLEAIGGEASAQALAAVLKKDGIMNHDQPKTSDPRAYAEMKNPDWRRTEELRELFLGVALYRLGDVNGLGRDVLERYAQDGRGIYARHAQYVLENK